MSGDVGARAVRGVAVVVRDRPLNDAAQGQDGSRQEPVHPRGERPEQVGQIGSFARLPVTRHEGLAEADLRVGLESPEQRGRPVDLQHKSIRTARAPRATARKTQLDREAAHQQADQIARDQTTREPGMPPCRRDSRVDPGVGLSARAARRLLTQDRQSAQPEGNTVDPDQGTHPLRHQRVPDKDPGQRGPGQRDRATCDGGAQELSTVALQADRHRHPIAREVQAHGIPAGGVVERRDEEVLVDLGLALRVGGQDVGVAPGVGVADLENGRDDPPVRRQTPEDRQGVKDVSEHSGMSKEQHPCRVGQLDPNGANLPQHNGFQLRQGRRATIEMVLGAQFGQATQPGRQARWVVEVDEPLVVPVGERSPQGAEAGMPHGADNERRHRQEGFSHQVTPTSPREPPRRPRRSGRHPRGTPTRDRPRRMPFCRC